MLRLSQSIWQKRFSSWRSLTPIIGSCNANGCRAGRLVVCWKITHPCAW